jgi:hypothetical protein
MYSTLLLTHSWLRWLVLLSAVYAIYKAYTGWKNQKSMNKLANLIYISSLHTQLVIGLLLYFVYSPITQAFIQAGMSAGMKDKQLRHWGVEHLTTMLIAITIAQIGSIKSKKKPTNASQNRTALIYFSISLFLILLMVVYGARPWFRGV